MLRVIALLLSLMLVVAACGEDDDPSGEAAATPTATEEAAPAGCEAAEEPAPKGEGKLKNPKAQLDPAKTYVATVSTNCGDFEITLDAKRAPKTGGSFKALADEGFFDEAPPQDLVYEKGIVAMAKTGAEPAGTSGSQFFVVTAEDAGLPPDYALLGKVTAGQDVVDKIGVAETNPATEKPLEPVVINSVKVTEG